MQDLNSNQSGVPSAVCGRIPRAGRRWRGAGLLVGVMVLGAFSAGNPGEAASRAPNAAARHRDRIEVERLRLEIERARGELRLASAHLERWNRIFAFAAGYRIAPDLAAAIYDAAVNERLDPDLAFRLIKLESRFDDRAESPVGAIGLAQVMLSTAREFDNTITRAKLFERDTNLRIGFRYLRRLIKWQDGDLHLALLAYNRGPGTVETAMSLDLDPSNGYEHIVLKGYRGRGILQ